ncbi:MAG: hypothetical protein P0Y53_05340 [Candidatus Pseudobacter hemicellulosilyticus]|uniref:Uncharacterized protein n=1 Tax=Candidatus Pseudobacter hemicellulosilyticus TaxID=3121375 RepID=A0AAJ6BJ35_9BACT|nr:MAG: hypothetical protein P0Y53_05340 [Pseudobacter sp.]
MALVDRAELLSFSYYFMQTLVALTVQQIIVRVNHVEKHEYNEMHIETVLGKLPEPIIKISDALNRFWDLAKRSRPK